MTTAHDLIVDQSAPMVEGGARLTTWYAQGHTDGLGDRLLMFDNTTAPSWELLRFKPSLARDPRFATALRHRMERLSTFQHPVFPVVRSIKELGHEDGLAVVSTHLSGVRLSDALKKPRSAEFALHLIKQLMPALCALHDLSPGIAHGALTLDRVVLTGDGRLMIREHMVGSALDSLELSAAELWAGFGILTPPSRLVSPPLDARSDITQLALVALSLMAGRRIGADEYPHDVGELLQRIVKVVFLRQWLERALQLHEHGFASSREATDALAELRQESPRDEAGTEPAVRLPLPPATPQEAPPSPPRAAERDHPLASIGIVPVAPRRSFGRAIRWAAIAAGVVALGEAAFIGWLLYSGAGIQMQAAAPAVIESSQPKPEVATAPPAPVAPLAMTIEQEMPGLRVLPAIATANAGSTTPDVRPTTAARDLPAAVPPRSGGLRVSSSIELHVLDGERLLGSSKDGPIIARAGRHEFEFVNSVIGYRVRREVDVKPGQITALSVTVPNGTLNINAIPWAAVWIDGTSHGETPLGNLSIVPGEHEIVFRHPQLGERRERVVVRPIPRAEWP